MCCLRRGPRRPRGRSRAVPGDGLGGQGLLPEPLRRAGLEGAAPRATLRGGAVNVGAGRAGGSERTVAGETKHE